MVASGAIRVARPPFHPYNLGGRGCLPTCRSHSSRVLSGDGLVGGNPTMNTPRLRRGGGIASSSSSLVLLLYRYSYCEDNNENDNSNNMLYY